MDSARRHRRAPFRRSLSAPDERFDRPHPRFIRRRHATRKDGGRSPERRSGNVQPRRPAVLDAIEASGYNTLHHRPSISKAKQARLLSRSLLAHLTNKIVGAQHTAPQSPGRSPQASPSQHDRRRLLRECHRIAKAARSNFYYAFFLLPKSRRDGIVALYAFMRLIDDVADEGDDLAAKQRGLANWRASLDAAVTGSDRAASSFLQVPPRFCPRWSIPCAVTTCPHATCTI